MQSNDKAIASLVRSMKRTLQDQHGINVPHSALRASYLQALGENPHAFAGREQAAESKVDTTVPAVAQQGPTWSHTLYLAEDDIGCLERFALDKEGTILLPEDFEFEGLRLEQQAAVIPRVSRYGLPDYLEVPKDFYGRFGLKLSSTYVVEFEDSGDDGGDSCKLIVSATDADWAKVLAAALEENPGFEEDLAEWVGLHYGVNFDKETEAKQLEWADRYAVSLAEQAELTVPDSSSVTGDAGRRVDVKFAWTYPDGSEGRVDAYVELDTRLIVLKQNAPADVTHNSVNTRIVVPCKGAPLMEAVNGYGAYYQKTPDGGGSFYIGRKANAQIAEEYGVVPMMR